MRIATQSIYDRGTAQMERLSNKADQIQSQISTGIRFTRASQDVSCWRQLSTISRASADQGADVANVKLAQGLLASTDTALEGIETQLQRARELAVQASGGTLNDEQKANIATALEAMVEDIYTLANQRDVRGQPLFGGATGDVAYTRAADGTISFAGTGSPNAIPIGDGTSVEPTVSGEAALGSIDTPGGPKDVFAILQGLAAAIRTGGTTSQAASSEALTTLQSAIGQVAATRASVGARGARLDLEAERLSNIGVEREEARAALEDVDVAASITELQKTLTILQATQSSFTKLTSLSLFDYLR